MNRLISRASPQTARTRLRGIKESGDVCERLCLVHAVEERAGKGLRNRFACKTIGTALCCLTSEIAVWDWLKGAFQPPRVIWVIRLTSPHLP